MENSDTPFTSQYGNGSTVRIPIAHHDGNYFCDEETLARLKANGQIVFRYADAAGEATVEANPNGSLENIAGICNEKRNVLGMMPHPERCAEKELGNSDGKAIFKSIIESVAL